MKRRLFVALDMPQNVAERLLLLCGGLSAARWTPPEQLHLTLAFIGEVDGTLFLDIREALADIAAPVFDLRLSGAGVFPPRGEPRVLWAGVAPEPALVHLHKKVTACLQRAGVELERRKFSPHITLARLSRGVDPSQAARWVRAHALLRSEPFAVDRFTLYESVLGRNGATHLPQADYALETAGHEKGGFNPEVEAAGVSGGDERNRTAE